MLGAVQNRDRSARVDGRGGRRAFADALGIR
jgi:hypothetical protein